MQFILLFNIYQHVQKLLNILGDLEINSEQTASSMQTKPTLILFIFVFSALRAVVNIVKNILAGHMNGG